MLSSDEHELKVSPHESKVIAWFSCWYFCEDDWSDVEKAWWIRFQKQKISKFRQGAIKVDWLPGSTRARKPHTLVKAISLKNLQSTSLKLFSKQALIYQWLRRRFPTFSADWVAVEVEEVIKAVDPLDPVDLAKLAWEFPLHLHNVQILKIALSRKPTVTRATPEWAPCL